MTKKILLIAVLALLSLAPLHARPKYAAELEPKVQKMLKDMCVPGAVVWVQSEELGSWTWTYGTRRLDGKTPVSAADFIRIGSNTKTMTGTVILELVEEGKLKIYDPVSKFVPGVPNGTNITVRQLLSMRSGLYNYTLSDEMNASLDNTPAHVFTPRELLAIAFKRPPNFAPGAKYEYSNTNFVLLGLIIEKITGRPAHEVFQRRIYGPLGLKHTSLPKPADASIPSPHPQGYQFGTNVSTRKTSVLPPAQQQEAASGTLKPTDVTSENPSWAWTAGAAISSADDLARYVRALVGGGLLSPRMQKIRMSSFIPSSPGADGTSYGLAMAKMGPMFGHIGDIPGYNSFMGYDPRRKLTIIVWTSLSAAPDGKSPATEVARAIIFHIYGKGGNVELQTKPAE